MTLTKPYLSLIEHIGSIVDKSRKSIVSQINQTMVMTYWSIGQYIVEYEQNGSDRAEYGSGLLQQLSHDLMNRFGKGFGYRNLRLIRQFYLEYQNWHSLHAKFKTLSRTHIVRIMHLKDLDERQFFMIECSKQQRSTRELDRQINSALYHRLALSKDKKGVMELSQKGQIIATSSDLIKDPYVLEFLGIQEDNRYSEKDLETAIINNLQMFLLELGKGFSFVARQQRITAEIDHFYIDLVFYNRLLKCFLLIDLKIGKLTHQDIGQMQMYVNRYDKEIKSPDENKTIGLILCREHNEVIIKYTLGDNQQDQIFSKEYQLYLPNKEELTKLLEGYDDISQ